MPKKHSKKLTEHLFEYMKKNILKRKIMIRVYAIYILRKVINPVAFKVYIIALSAIGFVSLVSVTNIFVNITSVGFSSIFNFSYQAFINTEITVQTLFILFAIFILWLTLDGVRSILKYTPRTQIYN